MPFLKKILEKHKKILCFEMDEPGIPALCEEDRIRFNGKGEEGHETFLFETGKNSNEFCKTARKPYDLAVCEILLVLKAHLPNFTMKSDGFWTSKENPKLDENWPAALESVKEFGIYYKTEISTSVSSGREYTQITPVFDRFESAVAAGMNQKPAKKMKKPSKKDILRSLKELVVIAKENAPAYSETIKIAEDILAKA